MKNLFSFNIEKSSGFIDSFENAEPYVLRKASSAHRKNQQEIANKMDELEKKWSLPSWLNYIKIVSVGIGAMLLSCVLMILIGVGFGPAFSNGWFIASLVFGILIFALGVVCFVIEYKRKKVVEDSDEYKEAMKYIDELSQKSEAFLNLPSEKEKVDVFFYTYITRDDKQRDNSAFKYLNMSLYLFEEDNKLCLATNNAVYGIDKSLFKRMLQNPKKVSFSVWNKEHSHSSEAYKEYKISIDHYGTYHVKGATSVVFENEDGHMREIVIPPYEVKHFSKILNIKVIEKEDEIA